MSEKNPPSRRETICVVVMLSVFLVFNLLTASRYPFVWIDEVMYSDPAFNLLLGHGFTSTAWYAQGGNELWAGNVPLHSWLLFVWLKVFGISITAVRSLNLVFMVATCVLIWRSCIRLHLVSTPRHRLLLLVLILGGYSLIFSYRSGRPDCLGLLAISGMFYAFSMKRNVAVLVTLFLLGVASPWIGLQLLPMLAVVGALLMLFVRREIVSRVVVAGLGAVIGLVVLVAFYKWHGVWESFLKSIGQHTGGGFFGLLLGGSFRHSNLTPKDFSFAPLFLLALLLTLFAWRRGEFKLRSPLGFGLVFSVVLTGALLISGKFPTYYGWMTYVPLAICVCATLSTIQLAGWQRGLTRLLLGLTVLIGVGLHFAAVVSDWSDRDPSRVEQFVRNNTRADDWIYCEFGAYYGAKTHSARTFTPIYLAAISATEKQNTSVLIIHPRHLEEAVAVIGGKWVATNAELVPARECVFGTDWRAGFLAMQNYRLTVYRRAP
ncbi:MAG: hypothetical protein HOP33_19695 [Verrucomicrobia bacterium]|nr:hypothetical protein [Verrucomicrobiota bacterium]